LLTASIRIALWRFLLAAYFGIFEITVPQAKRRQQRVLLVIFVHAGFAGPIGAATGTKHT
jgi:hypothetical protein